MAVGSLVARPAEVLHRRIGRAQEPVHLFVVAAPDVADPELVRPRPDRHPEGVAKAVRDDAALVRVGAAGEWVARKGGPADGIDPDDRAVEPGWVALRS